MNNVYLGIFKKGRRLAEIFEGLGAQGRAEWSAQGWLECPEEISASLRPVLLVFLLLFSTASFAEKTYTKAELMTMGEEEYGGHCLLCHKDDGKGEPGVFPSLVGSKIATGPVEKHITMVLHGKKGTAMVPFSMQINNKQVAAIITYERNSWGNDDTKKYGKHAGGLVQPSDVQTLR